MQRQVLQDGTFESLLRVHFCNALQFDGGHGERERERDEKKVDWLEERRRKERLTFSSHLQVRAREKG